MESRDNPFIEQFRTSVEAWTDERMISRDQLHALTMFNMYLVNLAESDGWEYDGHSLKMGVPMCVLTVKATIEGIPHVVFTSARSPTGCVVIFVRKLQEGWLEWVVDRYR